MIEPRKFLKDLVRTPITPEDRIGKLWRLDRNERTTGFPEEHLRNILASISSEEMVAYPELEPFYQKLADWLGVDRREVLIASGSDTSIKMVFEVYVQQGDEVVIIPPHTECMGCIVKCMGRWRGKFFMMWTYLCRLNE